MCGIVGYAGHRDARTILKDGLQRLEYRGYDSAGIALVEHEELVVEKTAGRVADLDPTRLPVTGLGIAHTRWATHGPPTQTNAHPHTSCDGRLAVVHNGVITNHLELRDELEAAGHTFTSGTDTEVIAHLAEDALAGTEDLVKLARHLTATLEGSYAFCLVDTEHPGELVAARQDSPLVLGVGTNGHQEAFVASDVVAFLEHTDQAVFLHDGDILHLKDGGWEVHPAGPRAVLVEAIDWDLEEATLAGYPHFMLKEIHEQPRALREALVGRTTPGSFQLEGELDLGDLAGCTDVHLVACGSSHHAGLLAHAFLEQSLSVPATSHIASELGRTTPIVGDDPLFVAVSQSGETADTLKTVRHLKATGHEVLAFTNVVGSTLTREASAWAPLRAGPELSVAATKSFTSQALVLGLASAQVAASAGHADQAERLLSGLREVPHAVQEVLDREAAFREAGRTLSQADRCFVLGSGPSLPVAMETALKIKEVSYVHAEAFPTGELKHGPLALVEDGTPAIVHAPDGDGLQQALTAMKEVAARGAEVMAITDAPDPVERAGFQVLELPTCPWPGRLFAETVAGQLVAYQAAVERGCDVDRPRNLAKSVTVE